MKEVMVIVTMMVKDECEPDEVVEFVEECLASISGGPSEMWHVEQVGRQRSDAS